MQKHQLALDLRRRQYAAGHVPRKMIDALSDDEIIDSYTYCSQCGQPFVTPQQQESALQFALTANQFLTMVDGFAANHHH